VIPEGWRDVPIGEICLSSQYGLSVASDANGDTPMIGMKDMAGGKVLGNKWARISLTPAERDTYRLNKGDLLLNRTNSPDLVGKVSRWDRDEEAVFASYLVRFVVDPDQADSCFLNYHLNSVRGQGTLKSISTRGVSQANINPTVFKEAYTVCLPPLPEQRRIAAVLDAWDDAIATAEKLVAAKAERRTWLADHLAFQAIEWLTIEDVAVQVSERAGEDFKAFDVFSCTKHDGLVLSDDYFSKTVYGADRTDYKVVASLHLAYATNHIEEGSIGLNTLGMPGIVSPMYTVFRATGINPRYLIAILKTERMRREFERRTPASVNRRGGLRWGDFAEIEIPCPGEAEQMRVLDMLDCAKADLQTSKDALTLLRLQKRGLMQKLLTGQWRVPESVEALMPGGGV
jgi:type I restriction enzyme, S subunit